MAKTPEQDDLSDVRRIMGTLVRQPPKPHEQMKLGKRTKPKGADAGKRARAKKAPIRP